MIGVPVEMALAADCKVACSPQNNILFPADSVRLTTSQPADSGDSKYFYSEIVSAHLLKQASKPFSAQA